MTGMLWNKNFCLLVAATVLFHVAVYMPFPSLHLWMMERWGYTELRSACVAAAFGLSLPVLGVFNSYLVDTFSRKQVCVRSILVFAVLAFLCPYATAGWQVVLVRIVQGSLCGVALMATGSTLAIDVTPSRRRDAANRVFAWAYMLALPAGMAGGWWGCRLMETAHLFHVSAGLCVVSAFLVWRVKVCFRAPLDLPLCSSDRFFLPRSFPPALNVMAVPWVWGMVFVSVSEVSAYVWMAAGVVLYLLVRQVAGLREGSPAQVVAGQLLTMCGTGLWHVSAGSYAGYAVGGGLVGLGAGLFSGCFLQMMVLLPRHCERGTGCHTYRLLCEAGLVMGIVVGKYMQVHGYGLCPVEWVVCVAGVVAYMSYTRRYFKNHYQPF